MPKSHPRMFLSGIQKVLDSRFRGNDKCRFLSDCRQASFASLLAMTLLFPVSEAYAAGEAEQYILTVRKVELKNTTGEWKPAFEGRLNVDLADPESAVRFENALAPDGAYQNVRLTLDETVQIKGRDGQAFTCEGGEIEIRGTASTLDDLPGEIQTLNETKPTSCEKNAGLMSVTLDLDYADRDTTIEMVASRNFDKAFTVKRGSKIAVSLRAPLTNMLDHVWPKYYGTFPERDEILTHFPQSFSEFSIKVDGATSFSQGAVEVKF